MHITFESVLMLFTKIIKIRFLYAVPVLFMILSYWFCFLLN